MNAVMEEKDGREGRETNGTRERRLVRPARLERATSWFVARRSIQLSYGRERLTDRLALTPTAVAVGTNSDYITRHQRRPGRSRSGRFPSAVSGSRSSAFSSTMISIALRLS